MNEIYNAIRVQKVIAENTQYSRRTAEDLIQKGQVLINGRPARLGDKISPNDILKIKGKLIFLNNKNSAKYYFLLNKPYGIISSLKDEKGRSDLSFYIAAACKMIDKNPDNFRLFSVGRLDRDTSGLLILTNDGNAANILAHPKHNIQKSYIAKISGVLSRSQKQSILKGIYLSDGFIKADKLHSIAKHSSWEIYKITLHSGKNRIIRRIFEHFGARVIDLKRISFGELLLGNLPEGELKIFNQKQMNYIYRLLESNK